MNIAYSLSRSFSANPKKLWDYWTLAEHLERWYSPTTLKVEPGSVTSEAKLGGVWAVGVDASEYGFTAYFFGLYTEVEPGVRLVHTMNYTQDSAEFEARQEQADAHLVEVRFESQPNGCLMTFTQIGEMPAEQAEQAKAGMESYFDNLEQYIALNAG